MRTEIDRKRLDGFIKQVGGTIAQGFNCAVTALGDRLGLSGSVAAGGPVTSTELAERCGLDERWLREWLRHQACVGQLEYDPASERFHLSPEARAVLADENHPAFLMGGFDSVLATVPAVPRLEEAFRTGRGLTYDDHGAACACGVERLSAYTQRRQLVEDILPMMDGVVARLEAGADVADVGCGGALSTISMARAFPRSRFVGYEVSEHALTRARANLAEARLANVRILDPRQDPLPERAFDLVTTLDVVHDTPFPDQLIASIHAALRADGSWLCEDIRSFPGFADNLAAHPLAPLLYGFSIMVCMSSGLSAPGGAGLGTLGFNEEVARAMTAAAGFTRFERLAFDNPINCCYQVRH
jgi:SAM-dependent methyltransferase